MMRIFAVFGVLFILCTPGAFASQDKYMQIRMLQHQIESLQSEHAKKYDELAACEKKATTYKIVGVSAMSAATIGLALNVKLQSKLNKLSKSGGGGSTPGDGRSDVQKCLDEMAMYCDTSGDGYDEITCELYRSEGCE